MIGNSLGSRFRVTTWGESHGPAIGVVIDGCPPKIQITKEFIQGFLEERRPGKNALSSGRDEKDRVEILSGVKDGETLGTPISLMIKNHDHNPKEYDNLKDKFRPGHADRAYEEKFGIRDHRGGGRSSGRETAARVAAGAIARKILEEHNIRIIGFTRQIGDIMAVDIDLNEISKNPVCCPNNTIAEKMTSLILEIKEKKDSIGGVAEFIVKGCPPGIGDPVFGKLDSLLAMGIMGIGGVKGVEIGTGFSSASMKGSENNDQMTKEGYSSNNSGGILGGISTGQDIIIRAAIKPTPSIGLPQKTVTVKGAETELTIAGRHDPCLVPRIIPVGEAMIAIILADLILR